MAHGGDEILDRWGRPARRAVLVTLPDGDRGVRGFVRVEPGTVTIEADSDIRMDRSSSW